MRALLLRSSAVLLVVAAGCASEPVDYTLFQAHMPRSILVLPPLDSSMEVGASSAYLSTVTQPLAEHGYYVFPVAVVDAVLRENGLPTPGDMHTISLAKIDDIFGADAVLYVNLTAWGTRFRVLDSVTEVGFEARLVDVSSGLELWRGTGYAAYNSSAGAQSLGDMIAGAIFHQVYSSVVDRSRDVARTCNGRVYCNEFNGLLVGPLHPDYASH